MTDQPNGAPAEPQLAINLEARIVQIPVKRPLDIVAFPMQLPFSLIKSLAAQIIMAEAAAEQAQAQEASKHGILRLTQ